MDFFTAMEVSASGLSAQRTRMNIAASNLANVNTTAPGGVGTYARKMVELESVPYPGAGVNGVKVKQIVSDAAPPREEFDPEHPDADANGYVYYPNVNVVEEMADMISASRNFQTNVEMMNTAKQMMQRVLTLGQ